MKTKKLASIFAEMLGTFALTAVVISVGKTYGTPIFTAIAAGVTLTVLISMFGQVSGGHFNPAITLGLLSIKKVALSRALVYVAAQVVGAVLAWKLFEWLSPDRPITLSTITEFNYQIFTAEAVGTGIFAMAVAATVYKKLQGGYAAAVAGMGLFLGSTAMAVVIVGRQIATGVLNPAIAIGIGNRPQNQGYLSFVLGPVVGAVVGMILYRLFFAEEPTVKMSLPLAVAAKKVTSVTSVAAKTAPKKVTTKKRTAKKVATKK